MSRDLPALVFLHGIQAPTSENTPDWRESLVAGWAAQGLTWTLDDIEIIEPRYSDLLASAPDEDCDPPSATDMKDAKSARAGYEVHRQALMRLVNTDDPLHARRSTRLGQAPDLLIESAVAGGRVTGADSKLSMPERYRRSPGLRNRVLNRVLGELNGTRRVVILAHSLGSAIALDLIGRLPPSLDVIRLVTVGSPLGHGAVTSQWNINVRKASFPYHQVGSWLNVWSPSDYVTMGRPIDHPAVVNCRASVRSHSHRLYLADPVTSLAVGEALFGNPSRELIQQSLAVERDLAPAERHVLRYLQAGRVMRLIIGSGKNTDRARRFAAALAIREQGVFDSYLIASASIPGGVHPSFARVMTDLESVPAEWSEADPDTWVDQMVDLMAFDFAEPADIDVDDYLEAFAVQMASKFMVPQADGRTVFQAIDDTRKALTPTHWGRYAAAIAGVAMLAAATGGIGLVAAPGAVGAAAITSGLAAFGPGGMVGGLITAGGLASAGSASLVASILNADGATTESAISVIVATALARQRLGKPLVNSPEALVLDVRSQLLSRVETERALSDRGSKKVKRDENLVDFCDRALEFIQEERLGG